jgi:hypothetical protein
MATNPQTAEDYLNAALPGFSNLTSGATNVIGNLLQGLPSPSTARQAAATFGITSGAGANSGLANNYGYNLYNQQGAQRQQQGIQDLLSTLGAYAGTVTPNVGQLQQGQEFGTALANQQNEFNQTEQDKQNLMLMQLVQQLGMNN